MGKSLNTHNNNNNNKINKLLLFQNNPQNREMCN